ncbi:hypothetical protein H9P43_006462 [Blastocladiella emersonii ATCC 22665]|nr:hypothetical protein H9P43_006462 [Blastocladiella emersonii ATCC 22665]
MQYAPIRLFISRMCPYAQRTTLALAEAKAITGVTSGVYSSGALELVEINLRAKPEWYLRGVNPSGKVPAMEITHANGGKEVLVESLPIARFILELLDAPQLTGLTPLERYRAAIFVDVVNAAFVPAFYALLREKNAEMQPAAAKKLLEAVAKVSAALHPQGPYATGEQFNWADIASASFMVRLNVLEHYRGFTVPDAPEYAAFHRYAAALKAHPSVAMTTASLDELVAFYAVMAL